MTVIGAGLSGMAFIKKARELDPQLKITLVDKNQYFFDRWTFWDNFSTKGRVELAQFSQNNSITLVQDTLERVNVKRRKLYFKDKECRDYTTLVVATGLKPKKLAIKGEHRDGFLYFSVLDPAQFRDKIKISSDFVVYISTLLGVRAVLYLRSLKKEVNAVIAGLDFLGDKKEAFLNYCAREGVGIYPAAIEEAIGEATVRAVKLNPLKVLSAQMLFLDSGFLPNGDFLESDGVSLDLTAAAAQDVYGIGGCVAASIAGEHFFTVEGQNHRRQAENLAEHLIAGKALDFVPEVMPESDRCRAVEALFSKYAVDAGEALKPE